MHLAKHRSYSRLAQKRNVTMQQREVYWKLADHHLREARRLHEEKLRREAAQ